MHNVHDLKTRTAGLSTFIQLHLALDPEMSLGGPPGQRCGGEGVSEGLSRRRGDHPSGSRGPGAAAAGFFLTSLHDLSRVIAYYSHQPVLRRSIVRHQTGMRMANNLRPGSYGQTAKLFHWLIFLLLAAQYAVGSIMPHIGRKTLNEGWVNWHLSLGAADPGGDRGAFHLAAVPSRGAARRTCRTGRPRCRASPI